MKLGLFGARADNGGLGCQTFEFFRHMKPDKTAIIDISEHNKSTNHFDRYTNIIEPGQDMSIIKGFPTVNDCREFLVGLDIVVCFEIPYNYQLFVEARKMGVKTVLYYNYEFLDYMQNKSLPLPDLLLSPSPWHMDDAIKKLGKDATIRLEYNPVARDKLPFRKIDQMKTFVHVAGVQLYKDRNGTELLLDAIRHIESRDIKIIIYSQHPLGDIQDDRVEVREMNIPEYWQLYTEGDCLILPRRYGGQTLQLNEAMSCGMIPIMLNCDPNQSTCHPKSLVDVTGKQPISTRGAVIDCFTTDPRYLAMKIDEFAQMPPEEVTELNEYSNDQSSTKSWERMQPVFQKLLEDVCTSQ